MSTLLPSAGLRARVALDKHGFSFTHSLGQNFLLDDALLRDLLHAAEIAPGENILEIGPGAGVMTALIAEAGARICAVELDEKLRDVLADVLAPYDNAEVVFRDFLKLDLSSFLDERFGSEAYRVIANLPYYITADILTRLVTAQRPPESISIMVQMEAAQRLMSQPGQKNWCALSALVQSYGAPNILREVPAECFTPPPHVTSCFLKIKKHAAPVAEAKDVTLYRRVIHAAFAMRRKTLANNLKAAFALSSEQTSWLLKACGLKDGIRGETLTLPQLGDLSDKLGEILNAKESHYGE